MTSFRLPSGPGATRRALLLAAAGAAASTGPAEAQTMPVTVGRDGWLFAQWDSVDVRMADVQRTLPVISQAISIIKGAGIGVAILLVPSKTRLYRQYLPPNLRVSAELDRRYGVAMAEFRKAGAIVPDLDTVFRERARNVQLWFKSDTHWTPMAAEIAAVEMAKAVGPTIPPSSRPGTQVTPLITRQHARGDLVRFLPDNQRSSYGMESYQVRDIVNAGGQNALIADDSADVALVGNSYVEPRYAFQPILSNQLMRPVSLFWKPNNVGPYSGLVQFLSSETFKQQRPKVIIWTQLELDLETSPTSGSWGQNGMTVDKFLSEVRRGVAA